MLIGIDFDNTIVGYDALFAALALEKGYLEEIPRGGKTAVRDAVRRRHGDEAWQALQAEAYGPRMTDATLMDGFPAFVAAARRLAIALVVVSHKSVFSHFTETGPNLRYTALGWMRANGFFEPGGLGFSVDDVYFEGTRVEKVQRIGALGCTHFIDDLPEVFAERAFPQTVSRILFAPTDDAALDVDVVAPDWFAVRDALFATAERAVA